MPIDEYVVKLVECLKFGMNFSAIKFCYTSLWRVRNVETWTIHYLKIPCLQARVVATCLKFIEIWEWFHETWLPCWLRRWLDLRKNMVHPTPNWRHYVAFLLYLLISIVVCATYFCSSMGLQLHLMYDHLRNRAAHDVDELDGWGSKFLTLKIAWNPWIPIDIRPSLCLFCLCPSFDGS